MGRYEADHILFGAAYYDEYLMMKGIDRIDEDMAMMKAAGLNVIRIAESTWSTCEPQPGVFDFTYVDRALDAAQRAGIDVIVGTPTYAVPSWLVKLDPSVLAVTPNGQGKYGARQIMDIVNATYRFYGERVIRKLISHVADHPAVIGYQVDNETKYYDSVSEDMQRLFVKYLREKFHGDLDELNHHFGLDYWSNRIDFWEDFPDVTATINESLAANSTSSAATRCAPSCSGRPTSCANTRMTTSSSPTTSISNGADTPTACSRPSTTSRPRPPWTSPAWTSTTPPRTT